MTADDGPSFTDNIASIVKVIFDLRFRTVILTALALVSIPSFGAVYNYYYTDYLHFSPITMGNINFVAIASYIVAILLVNTFFKGVGFKKFFTICVSIGIVLYSTNFILLFRINRQYGVSDELFCFSSAALMNFMAELTFLPILALGSRLCPPGLEGTTYAVFTAIFNSAHSISSLLGAALVQAFGVSKTDFSNLWKLTAIQVACLCVFAISINFIHFPRSKSAKLGVDSRTFSSISAQDSRLNEFYRLNNEEKLATRSFDGSTLPTVRVPKGQAHSSRSAMRKSHVY